ncbi:MAG TPA: ABC transporter substrate-binding protein [Candidatus Baltobacteraceae bacterium]|nr:ABC transporter substrate-binding protein [Candidatus Baltobacteraceae bacterium]
MRPLFLRLFVFVFALTLPAQASPALRVGSDISYAPLEFYAAHTKAVQGFDYDLAQALSAQLGSSLRFQNADFNSLISSLNGGKYDLVISAMSDTRARSKQVDFVDYFLAGSGILVQAGNPHHVFNLASLCGMIVDVERGTSQALALRAQSQKCIGVGLHAITLKEYATDDEALSHFLSGESMAHVSDYPVVAHLARTLNGGRSYAVAGQQFGVIPYGIAVAKKNVALRDRVQSALKTIIANGTYDRLLQKWGLQQGAMRSAPVNAGTKFE